MPYKKFYKKTYYKKSYNDDLTDTYAYHDIDMHQNEIKRGIERAGLENIRYVVANENLKKNEINAPGYKNGQKIFLSSLNNSTGKLTVNNKEQYTSDFAVAINPNLAKEMGWNCDIVTVEEN